MAGQYGNNVVSFVSKGRVNVSGSFVILAANGSSNVGGRQYIRLYNRGNVGTTVAIAYANQNTDGTFTTPTDNVKDCELLAGGEKLTLPLKDTVSVYGKLLQKAGESSNNSTDVIVTEMK